VDVECGCGRRPAAARGANLLPSTRVGVGTDIQNGAPQLLLEAPSSVVPTPPALQPPPVPTDSYRREETTINHHVM
jgi:hypothetical protein